jgi:predicted NodU family carbamoyl transferase
LETQVVTLYILSTIASFGAVFLKGFQQKNLIGNHKNALVLTSFAMSAFEVASITMVVQGGWWAILTMGIGGSTGMLCAVAIHDRLFRK